jgi:hypothetical protein
MCEKCIAIDLTIERYRHVKRSISDELTMERAQDIIDELEVEKGQLHSGDKK